MIKIIYLCGPMRGLPFFNEPAFNAAAHDLRKAGYEVFNPAEHDRLVYGVDIGEDNITGDEEQAVKEHGFNIKNAMLADLSFICKAANAIAVLPGWENSRGAKAETATAIAIGIPVFSVDKLLEMARNI